MLFRSSVNVIPGNGSNQPTIKDTVRLHVGELLGVGGNVKMILRAMKLSHGALSLLQSVTDETNLFQFKQRRFVELESVVMAVSSAVQLLGKVGYTGVGESKHVETTNSSE